jgi:FkbM family methyltransferase
MIVNTYKTGYGLISLYNNEMYIGASFMNGRYWDEDTLMKLKEYIDPNRDILEIGGHCGTSTIVYASFLSDTNRVHVYEPQNNMYNLLEHNIKQNNLQNKIIPHMMGVFCYEGSGKMTGVDSASGGTVVVRYSTEASLPCNFGGIGIGSGGEEITLTTINKMNLDNIGFIHCDAQGAENYIFSSGLELINKCKPVIYYEDNENCAPELYNNVRSAYPEYEKESTFNIKDYCLNILNYSECIEKFNDGIDTLLIP